MFIVNNGFGVSTKFVVSTKSVGNKLEFDEFDCGKSVVDNSFDDVDDPTILDTSFADEDFSST